MTIETPLCRYDTTAITLHWLVAIVVSINVAIGLLAANSDDNSGDIVTAHKTFGLTVLGLVVLRILWRFASKPPALPSGTTGLAMRLTHLALYVILLALPASGYLTHSAWRFADRHPFSFFGLFHVPRLWLAMSLSEPSKENVHAFSYATHVYASYALYALVVLHLAAVLKHHFVDGENEIGRMLPSRGPRRP